MSRIIVMSVFLFLFTNISLCGQENALQLPDSITRSLQNKFVSSNDRFEALAKAVDYYIGHSQLSKIFSYTNEIGEIANKTDDNYQKAAFNFYYGVYLTRNNTDTAFQYLFDAISILNAIPEKSLKTRTLEIRIYIAFSACYMSHNMFPEAYEAVIKGLEINKTVNDKFLEQKLNINLAVIYRRIGRYDECIALNKENIKNETDENLKGYIYNNIGNLFLYLQKYDSALIYFDSAGMYLKSPTLFSAVQRNIGEVYIYLEEYDKAEIIFHNALESTKDDVLLDNYSLRYLYLAKIKFYRKEYDSALIYIENSFNKAKEINDLMLKRQVLLLKAHILEQTDNYKESLEALQQYYIVNDSIENAQNIEDVNQLIIQQQIKDKEKAFNETMLQEKRQSKREKTTLILVIVLLALTTFVIIYIFVLTIGKKNILLKNKQIQEDTLSKELDLKNRELTSKVLTQIQKNEILTDVINKLTDYSQGKTWNEKQIRSIIFNIKQSVNSNSRKDFDYYFVQVHPDFFKNLLVDFPDLTQNEQRFCAFFKLNLSTKDIAAITNLSPEGVRTAKARLKKKFDLSGPDDSLAYFLSKY